MFSRIISNLKTELGGSLPGSDAQNKMAPRSRQRMLEARLNARNPIPSAILALIFPLDNVPHTVLMLRKSYDGVHSGQVSFPGGKPESLDKNLDATALREAEEELNIKASEVEVVGHLTEIFIPPSGFLVKPVIGVMYEAPIFVAHPDEVDEIIVVDINVLLNDKIVKRSNISSKNSSNQIDAPYFDIHGHMVWGATAMMLSEWKEILKKVM